MGQKENQQTQASNFNFVSELCEDFDKYSEDLLGNYVSIPKEKWPSSLLVRTRDENDPRLKITVSSSSTENEAMEHKRILESADFDTLRKNERFQTVYDTLSQNAKS